MPIIDQHELRVFDAAGAELDPIEDAGTLTADRGWSPHVQGQLSVREPASSLSTAPGRVLVLELTQRFGSFALTRDLTDLHSGDTTADLTAAYGGGDTADMTALITAGSWNTPVRAATGRRFELIITGRTRTRDEHRVELASSEAQVVDWLYFETDVDDESVDYTTAARTTIDLARDFYEFIAPDSPRFPDVDDRPIVNLAPIVPIADADIEPIAAGESIWSYVSSYLTPARQKIYSPGDGTLYLVETDATVDTGFGARVGENLIDWEISDEPDYNVIVRFTGTPTDPDARPMFSSVPTAFALDPAPNTRLIDVPQPFVTWPPPGVIVPVGDTPATPYRSRAGLDESPMRLVVVNDYSLMPTYRIDYQLPDSDEASGVVDAITWQLGGTWRMDLWI